MKRKIYVFAAIVLIIAIALVSCKKAQDDDIEARAFQTNCYSADGGDRWQCDSGGSMVFGSGAALVVTPGATVQIPALQMGSNYPVEYAANAAELLYVGVTATFTGTTSVVSTTHGMSTAIDSVICTIVEPDDDAGDPFLCYGSVSNLDVTLNAVQDDGVEATIGGTAYYILVGN